MKNEIRLVESGADFFRRLEQLAGLAEKELHLQTYRLADDQTGNEVADALIAAGKRGVSVYVLLDGFGSNDLSPAFMEKLKLGNIRVRLFMPVASFKGLFLGRRLHQKIAVADGRVALIGGINVGDPYRGSEGILPWLDFAAWIEGSVCQEAEQICRSLWVRHFSPVSFPRRSSLKSKWQGATVKIIHNDWFRYKNQVDVRYRRAVRDASKSITLAASYFLPGWKFRAALIAASRRKVSIKIIFPGTSDVPMMKFAAMHLYRFLLKNQVEIFEWSGSNLHAKLMMIDEKWCTLGSFNLNYLSTYGSIETNVETTEMNFIRELNQRLNQILKGCVKITAHDLDRNFGWLIQLRNWFAYRLMRRTFLIMTFFTQTRIGKRFFKE